MKRPLFERKHQKPTCGTMVWVTCATNRGPTAWKPVSPKGVSRFPQDFLQGAKISDTKNSEKIVLATTSLSRPGEDILQTDVHCGREELVSKRSNWIPSLPAGRLCRDFHLVTRNQNRSLTSTTIVENTGAKYAGKGSSDSRPHSLPSERHSLPW